jgi:hypothetical protein
MQGGKIRRDGAFASIERIDALPAAECCEVGNSPGIGRDGVGRLAQIFLQGDPGVDMNVCAGCRLLRHGCTSAL